MTSNARGGPSDHHSVRHEILERDDHQCQVCGTSGDETLDMQVHHVVPLAEGGKHEAENLITLCPNCHRKADYGELKRELTDELSSEVRKQVDEKVESAAEIRAAATDHAAKIEAFSDDSLDLIKIVLLTGSIAIPAVSFVSQVNGGDSFRFEGAYLGVFGAFWLCSMLSAGVSYYWGRTQGSSTESLKMMFESDEGKNEAIGAETEATYRRHLRLIFVSISCLVVSLVVLMLGIADAFGVFHVSVPEVL